MIAKKFIKSTIISARPNWLRLIDKRGGNTIQSLSANNRDWIIQSILYTVSTVFLAGLQNAIVCHSVCLKVCT